MKYISGAITGRHIKILYGIDYSIVSMRNSKLEKSYSRGENILRLTNDISNLTEYAKPFVKWAGGKSQLLETFVRFYPSQLFEGTIRRYIEPYNSRNNKLPDIERAAKTYRATFHIVIFKSFIKKWKKLQQSVTGC